MNSNFNHELKKLPLLPLRGLCVFPGSVITLDVGREKSIAAVEEAMKGDRRLIAVSQRDTAVERPQIEDLFSVGTIITIRQIMPLPDQTLRVMVQGETRAILTSVQDCGVFQRGEFAEQTMMFTAEMGTPESKAYMVFNFIRMRAAISQL